MAGASGLLIAGRYRLDRPVGQGGMGRVWSARDELLDRRVAVKEILFDPDVADRQREKQLRRMIVEARAAARLNHPGITTVYDVVEHDGAPVIVMEFVVGRSLAAVLRERTRLPVPRVAEIGVQVLDALTEAHAAGVVHRDLKPDNIMVTDRRAVITDFGIAAIADAVGPEGTAGLTTTGGMLGTPAYASPEQMSGEPATAASDMWSFGATLYAAVEGRLPFHGADLWTLRQSICESDPAPFHHAGALAPILTALLAKNPASRAPSPPRRRNSAPTPPRRRHSPGATNPAAGADSSPPAARPPPRHPYRRPRTPRKSPRRGSCGRTRWRSWNVRHGNGCTARSRCTWASSPSSPRHRRRTRTFSRA